jgi:hypothetical protein
VNPILKMRGRYVIYGERTMQVAESKLTAIHNVILVNYAVNGLANIGRRFVFDPNDLELITQVKLVFTEFLDKVKNERGMEDIAVEEKFEGAGGAVPGNNYEGELPPRGGELRLPNPRCDKCEETAESGKRQADRDGKKRDGELRLDFVTVSVMRHDFSAMLERFLAEGPASRDQRWPRRAG